MTKKKILSVVGARPQFIKLAPLSKHIRTYFHEIIVNSGQHYDDNMARIFFDEMGIPRPDYNLGISTGTHAKQSAKMLVEIESIIFKENPSCVVVFGDTNTTLAATLAASKLQIPIIHIEAGLRSYDKGMPEEQNRIVADHFSNLLFCPTEKAIENLNKEGIQRGVFFSGDLMYDALILFKNLIEKRLLEMTFTNYFVLTMHRPSNVDNKEKLNQIFSFISKLKYDFIFPVHPRTKKNISLFSIKIPDNIKMVSPLGYIDMMALVKGSLGVFTDSGGLQKEAFFLQKKCVTLRNTTEWIETVEANVNMLAFSQETILKDKLILKFLNKNVDFSQIKFFYGNGKSSKLIVDKIRECIT